MKRGAVAAGAGIAVVLGGLAGYGLWHRKEPAVTLAESTAGEPLPPDLAGRSVQIWVEHDGLTVFGPRQFGPRPVYLERQEGLGTTPRSAAEWDRFIDELLETLPARILALQEQSRENCEMAMNEGKFERVVDAPPPECSLDAANHPFLLFIDGRVPAEQAVQFADELGERGSVRVAFGGDVRRHAAGPSPLWLSSGGPPSGGRVPSPDYQPQLTILLVVIEDRVYRYVSSSNSEQGELIVSRAGRCGHDLAEIAELAPADVGPGRRIDGDRWGVAVPQDSDWASAIEVWTQAQLPMAFYDPASDRLRTECDTEGMQEARDKHRRSVLERFSAD